MALGTDTVDEGHLPAEKIAELEPDDKRAKVNRPKAQKEWTSVTHLRPPLRFGHNEG
jgi:hypothetical protein